MNRVAMTFILLAGSGGCMAVDPDPIDDYPYGAPRSAATQPQSSPQSNPAGWGGADGKASQTTSSDWIQRASLASSNGTRSAGSSLQNATTASKSSSGSSSISTESSVKASSTRPAAPKTDKTEDTLVKASYTETKPVSDNTTSGSGAAKPVSSKPPEEAATRPEEAESPPVNLGLLRLINSKRITFHYEVKDPASTGVADLEIWGTTDQRNWKKYDATRRSASSLVVDVNSEGLYGFTMIAHGKGDQTKNQPPLGEPPQMWVAVDLTKPVVLLLGAEMNVLERTPCLVVRWNATDRNLGPRPITLLYSERPEGPWSPIVANLENSGHYAWVLPSCAPANLCVRVQATDLMGNVGMAQTATLHIPGRSSTNTAHMEQAMVEPSCLSNSLTTTSETSVRPLAVRVPRPSAAILSVDGE
jgi:hypothetical protein